jgi:hypothetical protein
MKTFRQHLIDEGVLDDVLNLGSKFLYFWHGKWVMNTKHGLERILQRSKIGIDGLKKLFRTALEHFMKMQAEVGETMLFFSKSLNQGFIAAVGPKKNLQLVTFLPPGKSFPKPGTEKIVVESEEIQIDHYVEMD